MRCPFCHHLESQVKDSRPSEDHSATRRRRFCPQCQSRFTTFERVQLREIVVVKNDGRKELFNREKLERSIMTALRKRPIEEQQVDVLITEIIQNLEGGGESDVTSQQIGAHVMQALITLDKVAYVRFASVYKDFDEVSDFKNFLGQMDGSEKNI